MARRQSITLGRSVIASILISIGLTTVAANAQERTWRLGLLTPGAEIDRPGSIRKTTLQELSDRGFSVGRNLVYLPAAAEGNLSRLPELARMLAQQRVDAIIVVGTLAARAAMTAAPNTPIVLSFSSDDPVKEGLAVSLARPGRSVTGIFFRAIETDAKRLELLSEALPTARVFGFLAAPTLEPERSEVLTRTAAKLGVSLKTIVVQSPADYAAAFEAFHAEGAAGVLVMGTTILSADAPSFSRLATERGMATICEWEYMARAGCMLGFGPDLVGLRRLTGDYVARIFNGTNPAEIPIQLPDRFTLTVNGRIVAQLKLQLSPVFLARVDEEVND
ncbi:MAG: ABC transporter substrate-binding protein [Bradyrhizobium sp.]|jgi:putative tryptophan/tyrosine transport system substrate-binding protein